MDSTFDYSKAVKEKIACNLCNADNYFILANQSVNGLAVQTCLCKRCGLIYINPRMTKAGYDNYYKYFYRIDRDQIKEKEEGTDLEVNFANARKYGQAIARRLKGIMQERGLTLDIGSSTGGVLRGLKDEIPDLELLGVEPSVAESGFANKQGIKTITSLFENFISASNESLMFSNIFCVRTLNHLLDPYQFFKWSKARLKDGGCLILEVKNFRHQARRTGSVAAGVQIDHPYMFTPETLKALVEASGFTVAYMDVDEYKDKATAVRQRREGLSVHHIRLVAVKSGNQRQSNMASNSGPYRQLRRQFSRTELKLYYWLFYTQKLSFLRRLVPFLSRN